MTDNLESMSLKTNAGSEVKVGDQFGTIYNLMLKQ